MSFDGGESSTELLNMLRRRRRAWCVGKIFGVEQLNPPTSHSTAHTKRRTKTPRDYTIPETKTRRRSLGRVKKLLNATTCCNHPRP
jgi:hypothetical protein